MRIRSWSICCLTFALATPALAAKHGDSASETRNQALLAYQHDLVSVLAPRADAMPLLAAALLARPLQNQPKYNTFHSLIERAAKAPDATPAIRWTQLTDCDNRAGSCPNDEALKALTEQAGDNAAVWLIKLGQDSRGGHEAQAKIDLAKAASARLYDDYTGTALKALATSASILPTPEAALDPASAAGAYGVQVMLVYGLAGLQPQPQPGMQAAAKMCEDGKDDPAVKAECLKLAHVLEWGSSPLSHSLGLHLREILADDPAEQEAARNAMANLSWQVKNFAVLSARATDDKALAQHLLMLARNGGTEMSALLAALREAGIPADAPQQDAAPAAAASSSQAGNAP